MLLKRIPQAFSLLHDYRDPYERLIAQDLLRYVIVLAGLLAVGLVLPTLVGIIPFTPPLGITIVLIYVFLILIGLMVQIGRVYTGRNLLLLVTILSAINAAIQFDLQPASIVGFLIPLAVAGLLSSRGVIVAVTLLTMGGFAYVILSQPAIVITITSQNRGQVLFSVLLGVVLIGQFAVVFGAGQQRVAQLFSRDIRSLRRTLDIAELDTLHIDEPTLIAKSLRALRSGFDRVQIYLIDPRTRTTATPYYEALGQAEIQAGQPVDLGADTALNEVIRTGQLLIITPESGELRRRHLAPGMRMAILVPLVADEQVLGVYDFQLTAVTELSSTQIDLFRLYGQRLGVALARVRLVSQLNADLQLQQSVIDGLRRRLDALERNVRSDADASSWQRYFQEVASGALGYDIGAGATVLALDQLPAESYDALHAGQMVVRPHDDGTLVTVPIRLREVLLGALSFHLPPGRDLNLRQQELIQNVVDRLALALENRRLLQQSQSQAQREAKASEVATVLFGTTDIATLLNTAAVQFNEALGAVNTSVRVLSVEANDPS